jgi:hypothetical protein
MTKTKSVGNGPGSNTNSIDAAPENSDSAQTSNGSAGAIDRFDTESVEFRPVSPPIVPDDEPAMAINKLSACKPQLIEQAPEKSDPFDITRLRLDQSFTQNGVKKLFTTVPVRKPHKQEFSRVHARSDYRLDAALIVLKDDRETYLVPPVIAHELPGECILATIFTAINRQGVVFLWPVPLPAADGRVMEWHRSQAEAASLAMRSWVRVQANMSLGAYEIFQAAASIPDPEWPDLPFQELLRIAFKDKLVDRLDHPVVRRLRGLA